MNEIVKILLDNCIQPGFTQLGDGDWAFYVDCRGREIVIEPPRDQWGSTYITCRSLGSLFERMDRGVESLYLILEKIAQTLDEEGENELIGTPWFPLFISLDTEYGD
jgi:hypothetical protein